ncbi:MAG: zinc ribbon domain-containing protein [Deinococcota bacterium]
MDDPPTTLPALTYRLCPRCARAVPGSSEERYCASDGTRLLEGCPSCHAPIASPYARFCMKCGVPFTPPESGAEAR